MSTLAQRHEALSHPRPGGRGVRIIAVFPSEWDLATSGPFRFSTALTKLARLLRRFKPNVARSMVHRVEGR
jgi:hypothetical protein